VSDIPDLTSLMMSAFVIVGPDAGVVPPIMVCGAGCAPGASCADIVQRGAIHPHKITERSARSKLIVLRSHQILSRGPKC